MLCINTCYLFFSFFNILGNKDIYIALPIIISQLKVVEIAQIREFAICGTNYFLFCTIMAVLQTKSVRQEMLSLGGYLKTRMSAAV